MGKKKKKLNVNPQKEAERKAAKKERQLARKKFKKIRNTIITIAALVGFVLAIWLYFREPAPKSPFEAIEQSHTIDLSSYVDQDTQTKIDETVAQAASE